MNFTDKLINKIKESSFVVVGIDPNFDLMPKDFIPNNNSKDNIKTSLLKFCIEVINSCYDLVPAVKFQSSYFEQFGTAGILALSESILYAKNKGLLVILDAKRGDIGSTSKAYAKAYLEGKTKFINGIEYNSDLEVDCMTINPFLGEDSIIPFIELANNNNKGLFVLVKTSNPDSKFIMNSINDGVTVSEKLGELVNKYAENSRGKSGFSNIGAVIGATYPQEAKLMRKIMPYSIFLVPGVGAQGGTIETAKECFNNKGEGAIIPISRAITYPSISDLEKNTFGQCVRNKVSEYIHMTKNELICFQ